MCCIRFIPAPYKSSFEDGNAPFFVFGWMNFTGSAKARSDQLGWRDDSGERRDADTGIGSKSGSNACSTASSSSANSGKVSQHASEVQTAASNIQDSI